MTNREFEALYRENFDLVYRYALGLTLLCREMQQRKQDRI